MTVLCSIDYKTCLSRLNSLQSNAATIEKMTLQKATFCESDSLPSMIKYLDRIGYKRENLSKLNVVHVTGTKGKGSVSCFVANILQNHGYCVGLYTSPHLKCVRERIRINGKMINELLFAKYFGDVWERLVSTDPNDMPGYFRFLTLVAFHTFSSENVTATVLEVGIGGRYDCTNVVPEPRVCAITSIGHDHMSLLGNTLPLIAHNKAGIIKKGIPVFVSEQTDDLIIEVFNKCAAEVCGGPLTVVSTDEALEKNDWAVIFPDHQKQNIAVALSTSKCFLQQSYNENLARDAVLNSYWPGRNQRFSPSTDENLEFFFDGAHTIESLQCAADWYVSQTRSDRRWLVFNCTGDRSVKDLLSVLKTTLANKPFEGVIFTKNEVISPKTNQMPDDMLSYKSSTSIAKTIQQKAAEAWRDMHSLQDSSLLNIQICENVNDAFEILKNLPQDGNNTSIIEVLVCGSIHLLGCFFELLNIRVD